MYKRIHLIALTLVLSFATLASAGDKPNFEPGAPAPEIHIDKWLVDKPIEKDFLINKTIILEFWATWCRPCVMTIPHINKLVDEFASDSVVFLSISNESKEKVLNFMKNKTMKPYVATDLKGKTNNNYKVRFIPLAYVIDSFGRIIWEGHPAGLNGKIIKTIIDKKHLKKK